mgnify:CR=1 FL=1
MLVWLVLEAPVRGGARSVAVTLTESAAWTALSERVKDMGGRWVDCCPNTEGHVGTIHADYTVVESVVQGVQHAPFCRAQRVLPTAPGEWYVRIREGVAPFPVARRTVDWYTASPGKTPYLICTVSQVPVEYLGFDWLQRVVEGA